MSISKDTEVYELPLSFSNDVGIEVVIAVPNGTKTGTTYGPCLYRCWSSKFLI